MNEMVIEFDFIPDEDAKAYCIEIVKQLMVLFDVSQEEAVGRINRAFAGQQLGGSDDWIYHEMPEDQAKFIYYEVGTNWWIEGSPLKPKPYP